MIDINDYVENDIVKSLREAGLSDEFITSKIESGEIQIEKACKEKEIEKAKEDFEEVHRFSEHKDKDGKVVDSDEDEKEYHDKKEKKEKKFEEKEIKKSLDNDFEKSFGSSTYGQRFEELEKSVNAMAKIIKGMADYTPNFKGANFNSAVIEKSIAQEEKSGTVELSLSKQREITRNVISKAIAEESDINIQKSITNGVKTYLIHPDCKEVSVEVIKYFNNKGINLVD